MIENFKLFYSIDNILNDFDISDFIQDYPNNLYNEYKSDLWTVTNTKYGEIKFNLNIKYDDKMNYITYGKIILILDNNDIYIEALYENNGCNIDFLSEKFSVNSQIYLYKNQNMNEKMNINFDYFIKDESIYGIVTLNGIN